MTQIPKSHPRYISLKTRNKIVEGVEIGVTSIHGLMAHGRGESFDYFVGEKTNKFALKSIEAAAAALIFAKHPVISVNGNAAALVPNDLIRLSKILNAPLEINIFHASKKRELNIKKFLEKNGAKNILLPQKKFKIKYLNSNRKYINPYGIFFADVVFVPLEDGDRTEALIKNGKKVITIDLNPMSRTARTASITIVDNIIRVMPLLIKAIEILRNTKTKKQLNKIIREYDNNKILGESLKKINSALIKQGEKLS